MRHHPRIGFTYMPSTKLRIQGANGGYLVRTNAAGFRSDREFERRSEPGVFRVLLFGDSQTAGDGLANQRRYSDLLEAQLPGIEIHNYGLSGSGPDQQFLTYVEHAHVDHDLVIIAPYAENIRRLGRHILKARDEAGEVLFRSKPYYELVDGQIELQNVPVSKQVWTESTLPDELRPHVYVFGQESTVFRNPSGRHARLLGRLAPVGPVRRAAKAVLKPLRKVDPFPEYAAGNVNWLLFRAILTTWITQSRTPVLVMPLPHETALRQVSDPTNHRARFRELASETGCHLHDPLDDLLDLGAGSVEALWSTESQHLSADGHAALARSMAPVLRDLIDRTKGSDHLPR